MDLIEIHPQFNLYNFRWPIRTGVTHDPPAKFVFRDEAQARVGIATDSLVSHGCIISGGRIHRSVLGVGCRVNSFSEVEESVLFERVRIGRHAKIRRAIIDKDVEIPSGTEIGFDLEADRQRFFVTDEGHRRHPQARQARRERASGVLERNRSARTFGFLLLGLRVRSALRLRVGTEVAAARRRRRSGIEGPRRPPKAARPRTEAAGRGRSHRRPRPGPGPRSSRARASLTASGRPLNT